MLFMLIAVLALGGLASCGAGAGGGPVGLPPFNMYWPVAVADLNGDGKLDIVGSYSKMAGPPPHPGVVAIYLQDVAPPGNFLSPVNGDNKPDLVIVDSGIVIRLQDPANPGQFLPPVVIASQ